MRLSQQEEVIAKLVHRTWNDAKFKAEFMANPVAAIEQAVGSKIEVPVGAEIVVVDQTEENTVYLNIPQKLSDMELSDEQLEAVAGGSQWGDCGQPSPLDKIKIPGLPKQPRPNTF